MGPRGFELVYFGGSEFASDCLIPLAGFITGELIP
jgi:hypothetical protein